MVNILRDVQTRDMLPGEPTNGFAGAWSAPVQYLSLHEDDAVSISIFLIRKGELVRYVLASVFETSDVMTLRRLTIRYPRFMSVTIRIVTLNSCIV